MFSNTHVLEQFIKTHYPDIKSVARMQDIEPGSICVELDRPYMLMVRGKGTHCGYPRVYILDEKGRLVPKWALGGKFFVIGHVATYDLYEKGVLELHEKVNEFSKQYHINHHTVDMGIEEIERKQPNLKIMADREGTYITIYRSSNGVVCSCFRDKQEPGDTVRMEAGEFRILAQRTPVSGEWRKF